MDNQWRAAPFKSTVVPTDEGQISIQFSFADEEGTEVRLYLSPDNALLLAQKIIESAQQIRRTDE
jgi:hypothetical protein